MQAKEYDLADKNGLADFLEDADIQLVPRARGRVTPTPNPAINDIIFRQFRQSGVCSVCSSV